MFRSLIAGVGQGVAAWLQSPNTANNALNVALNAINLTGGQIAFPATQNPSTNANTLDDYEEGIWTPSVSFATPGTSSFTYSTQNGTYTKIGNLIYVRMDINFTPTIGTGSGNVLFGTAPFSPANTAAPTGIVSFLNQQFTWPAGTTSLAFVFGSATQFALLGNGSAISGTLFTTATLSGGNSHIVQASLVYQV